MSDKDTVVRVENLQTYFNTYDGLVKAVDGVSFEVKEGETLGIVGESGCGKSVTAMSILRLLKIPPAIINNGKIWYLNKDLLELSESNMREIRGNEISMIFQEPMTSLNPVLTIGMQIAESIQLHQHVSKKKALVKAINALELVGIPEPKQRVNDYPHQLSGGMRQRVMIAMALSCNPKLLIADEPTTALDVTIQAQILNLMIDLKEKLGTAIILITHDLGIIAEMAQRVVVMYAGRKVEEATVEQLFSNPKHPYTSGLLGSVPRLNDSFIREGAIPRLKEIKGTVPSLREKINGCAFAPRCHLAAEKCNQNVPPLEENEPNHWVACWETA